MQLRERPPRAAGPLSLTALVLAVIPLLSCHNALYDTIKDMATDYHVAGVAVDPTFSTLTSGMSFSVTFTKVMDPDTITLGGDLGPSATVRWVTNSETGVADDTVAWVEPADAWPLADGLQTLTISCTDAEGFEAEELSLSFGVIDAAIYVSEDGDDDNPGTPGLPLRTIAAAEDRVVELNSEWTSTNVTRIRLSQGVYPESGVTHNGRLVLEGGYKKGDWTVQDPVLYPSVVQPDASSSGSGAAISCAGAGTETEIRDITINCGASSGDFTALQLTDSSPTLEGVTVSLSGVQGTCYGINAEGNSNPVVEGSSFTLSDYGDAAYGVFIETDAGCTFTLNECTIASTSAASRQFVGVYVRGCAVQITACTIQADNAGTSDGIWLNTSPDAVIRNNVVRVRSTDSSYTTQICCMFSSPAVQNNTLVFQDVGVQLQDRCSPRVENNLFICKDGATYPNAFYEVVSVSYPKTFKNNYFSNTSRVYLDYDQWVYYPASMVGTLESGYLNLMDCTASANAATDTDQSASFDSSWDLTASAPSAITTGGLDLSAEFTTDRAGRTRPTGGAWSIGAFQRE